MKGLVEQPVMLCSPVVLLRDGVCCPRGRGGAGTRFQMTLWASPVLAQQASQSASFGSADCIGLLSATLSIPTNPAKHFFPPLSVCFSSQYQQPLLPRALQLSMAVLPVSEQGSTGLRSDSSLAGRGRTGRKGWGGAADIMTYTLLPWSKQRAA